MVLNWFKKKTTVETPKKETPDTSVPKSSSTEQQITPPPSEKLCPEGLQSDGDSHSADAETASDRPNNRQTLPVSQSKGLFARLKKGLSKTRQILTTDIEDLFNSKKSIDEDFLEELEELLITSDIGVQTAMALMESIQARASKIAGPDELKEALKEEICALLKVSTQTSSSSLSPMGHKPHIIMVVGVNGVGKTTTIGKLAARATAQGQSVLIAAADTFRAAAIEQLSIWAQRAKADLIKHKADSDPAAVVFDSIEAALARNSDVVFIDTAGRLHTKVNLMEELKKIRRIIAKKIPDAPHEILLVLDATTGQNAISQAKLFHEALGVTGLALTKLDGTAKGGIVVSICQSLNIPLKHIGVGESIEDLQPFDPQQFVQALF